MTYRNTTVIYYLFFWSRVMWAKLTFETCICNYTNRILIVVCYRKHTFNIEYCCYNFSNYPREVRLCYTYIKFFRGNIFNLVFINVINYFYSSLDEQFASLLLCLIVPCYNNLCFIIISLVLPLYFNFIMRFFYDFLRLHNFSLVCRLYKNILIVFT